MRTLILGLALLVATASGAPAQTYSYEWNYAGTFYSAGTIDVTPDANSQFTLGVYLRETSNTTTLADLRLFSYGVRAEYSNPTNSFRVVAPGDVTNNGSGPGTFNDFFPAPTVNNAASPAPPRPSRSLRARRPCRLSPGRSRPTSTSAFCSPRSDSRPLGIKPRR